MANLFGKCPSCKNKLKLSPWQNWKSFRPFPCPHCGAMLVRRIWAAIFLFAGLWMNIAIQDIFDPYKSARMMQMIYKGNKNTVYLLMGIWGIIGLGISIAGIIFLSRFYLVNQSTTKEFDQHGG